MPDHDSAQHRILLGSIVMLAVVFATRCSNDTIVGPDPTRTPFAATSTPSFTPIRATPTATATTTPPQPTAPPTTTPSQPTATPGLNLTPTPLPTGGISGLWIGQFTTNDSADCHSDPEASATLEQTGFRVTGTFRAIQNTCGFGGDFTGNLVANGLVGTLTKGQFGPANVRGTVDGSTMRLQVEDLRTPVRPDGSWELIPGGTLDLRRQ